MRAACGVLFGEPHKRKDVVARIVEASCQLRKLRLQFGSDDGHCSSAASAPYCCKHGIHERQHNFALTCAGVGNGVAHELHAASLPRRLNDLRDRCLSPR